MAHKIFTSQSNLNLGRNRNQRRLDAKIDSQKNVSKSLLPFSGTGEESNFNIADVNFDSFQNPSPVYCPHKSYCATNIPKFNMKCMEGFNKDCNIKKFYDKYKGLDINFLGIGSKI